MVFFAIEMEVSHNVTTIAMDHVEEGGLEDEDVLYRWTIQSRLDMSKSTTTTTTIIPQAVSDSVIQPSATTTTTASLRPSRYYTRHINTIK